MRASPSHVPGIERDVYLVLDDFGRMGSAWRSGVVRSEPLHIGELAPVVYSWDARGSQSYLLPSRRAW